MEYTQVGKLKKSFGTQGFIRVAIENGFDDDLLAADVWFCEEGSNKIPYFVEEIKNKPALMVRFEDVDGPEVAKRITGSAIFLRNRDINFSTKSDDGNVLLKLVGFTIIDEAKGEIGTVKSIEEYPQQLMAFVVGESSEFLVPLIAAFLVDIDSKKRIIYMELPEGIVPKRNT